MDRAATDQILLLMEKHIGVEPCRRCCSLSGLDNLTNDLPVRPAFVAFVDRTARDLREATASAEAGWWIRFVPLRAAAARTGESLRRVEIIDPDDHSRSAAGGGGHRNSLLQELDSGRVFTQIRFVMGQTPAPIGVNPDRASQIWSPLLMIVATVGKGSASPDAMRLRAGKK